MPRTPGPWVWTTADAGPKDEWGIPTRGPINPHTFKFTGHANNPELYGGDPESWEYYENRVLSGGGGEYKPYSNPEDALLIAAAPDLLDGITSLLADYDRIEARIGGDNPRPPTGDDYNDLAAAVLALRDIVTKAEKG